MRTRERNKAEKSERIRSAALKLFAERGYDATTIRDVAREAHVALGTISLYAADKRDLTLLVFNKVTTKILELSVNTTRVRGVPFEERVLTFFEPFYRDWASNARLARIFLQINYYSGGMHGEEYTSLRSDIAHHLEMIVADAVTEGSIRPDESTDIVAQHLFLTFSATARWWIGGDNPIAEEGIAYLRRLICLQIKGLNANGAGAVSSLAAVKTAREISRSKLPTKRRWRVRELVG